MGQLGYTGYGIRYYKGTLILLEPGGARVLKRALAEENLFDSMTEESTEEDLYVGHAINREFWEYD